MSGNKIRGGALLARALKSLKVSIQDIEVPTRNNAISLTPATNTESSRDCHVNPYCGCVDSSVNDQITIKGVQRALKELGFEIDETASCDSQTRTAIMAFQKQEQEKGFQPPDGREFLRCDACVGPNTLAAMNAKLKPKKNWFPVFHFTDYKIRFTISWSNIISLRIN